MEQIMYYLGLDVRHESGNRLLMAGFRKSRSLGLQGTSRYRLAWDGGEIEMHGACAGWFGEEAGVVYFRRRGRFYLWQGAARPVPGEFRRECVQRGGGEERLSRVRRFLAWYVAYEKELRAELGEDYRRACFREYKRLARSRSWLSPERDLRWLVALERGLPELSRARNF